VKAQLRDKALHKTEEVKNKYWLASSKSVTVYKQDGTVFCFIPGIRVMAKHFKRDHKNNNKAIKPKFIQDALYVKLDDSHFFKLVLLEIFRGENMIDSC
jgi:hypothetical protein